MTLPNFKTSFLVNDMDAQSETDLLGLVWRYYSEIDLCGDLDYRLLQDVPENGPYGLPPSYKGQTLGQWYQGKVEEVVGATVTVRFATTTEPLRIFRKTLTDFPFPAFVNCFFEAGEYGDDIQYALRDGLT